MWGRHRPAVQDFRPDEALFYRVSPDQVSGGAVVLPLPPKQPPFDFPRFSVNWSRFSEPEWVLIRPTKHPDPCYDGFRVGAIRVRDLPDSYEGFTLRTRHEPKDDNYSHFRDQKHRQKR